MRKLIAPLAIVVVIAAALFLFRENQKSRSASVDSPATPLQNSDRNDSPLLNQAEPSEPVKAEGEVPDAAVVMDESNIPEKTEAPDYIRRVADFKEAFAAGEPCRYIKVINKLASSSLIEVFAKEPAGQSTSAKDTELLNRLYTQGAFATKPSTNPVVSTKSEEFLIALRYAGLVEGTKRASFDFQKSEAMLRKIASREPDNGAPLFFLSDVLASQKKDGRALLKDIFKTTKFETYWEDVALSIERQAEGSPDHYLVGSLLMYSLPSPELTAPLARIRIWIEDGDENTARSALAWAEPLVEEARRSGPILGGGMAALKAVEFATFQTIANAARKKLKLPLDMSQLSSEAPPMQDEFGENLWSAFEDLEGRKFDDERSKADAPCDRRTMDRHYQRYLTREWRRGRS